jgi:hypothetical protein
MKYSILIQGNGEAQTGKTNAADIATSKLVSDLKGGGHQITHASIILDDTKRLPLVGGEVKHEIPEGIATATAEELPAEIKKLDKKELQAAVLALRTELDAAKALLEEATAKPAEDGGNEISTSDPTTTNEPTE